jgi:hypothetical protein
MSKEECKWGRYFLFQVDAGQGDNRSGDVLYEGFFLNKHMVRGNNMLCDAQNRRKRRTQRGEMVRAAYALTEKFREMKRGEEIRLWILVSAEDFLLHRINMFFLHTAR